MNNSSYWQKTATLPSFSKLTEDSNIDIAIIGAGITGIMTAYYLRNSGMKIAVFEQDTLASKTTSHTTAKISFLHKTIYQFLDTYYGIESARQYLKSNLQAMQDIQTIIQDENIACEYQENSAFIYTQKQENIARIEREAKILQFLGVTTLVDTLEDTDIVKSLGVPNQATFHPIQYLAAIVSCCVDAGIVFYEHSQAHSFILEKNDSSFLCNTHQVIANTLIFATRYPPVLFPEMYFLKLSQTKEFVWHKRGTTNTLDSFLCIDNPIASTRATPDGLLHSGYEHELGTSFSPAAQSLFTNKELVWSAQDSKAGRGIPYIGYFSKQYPHCFIACGFNKWGMTLSHVSARLLADIIMKQENPYQSLYSIDRKNTILSLKQAPKLLQRSIKGMIVNRFVFSHHSLSIGEGKVIRIRGKLRAVYRDANGTLHSVSPYCRHLKCVVAFNAIEKTWDCPCHGSRYDIHGNILEGPTLKKLPKYK